MPSEWYRGQNWWGGMCISWNSWWHCSIARTSKIYLDWHQKSDFDLNSNLHVRHSCNQNMQNIVTWGQNMSANIKEFVCISMGGLFSGVPPWWLSRPAPFWHAWAGLLHLNSIYPLWQVFHNGNVKFIEKVVMYLTKSDKNTPLYLHPQLGPLLKIFH